MAVEIFRCRPRRPLAGGTPNLTVRCALSTHRRGADVRAVRWPTLHGALAKLDAIPDDPAVSGPELSAPLLSWVLELRYLPGCRRSLYRQHTARGRASPTTSPLIRNLTAIQ